MSCSMGNVTTKPLCLSYPRRRVSIVDSCLRSNDRRAIWQIALRSFLGQRLPQIGQAGGVWFQVGRLVDVRFSQIEFP